MNMDTSAMRANDIDSCATGCDRIDVPFTFLILERTLVLIQPDVLVMLDGALVEFQAIKIDV